METLKKFWHWADNELPCRGYEGRDLFDKKATAGGPLSEEAQEAMQQAIETVGLRAPDVLHPSGEVLRPAIKLLSFAILEAWQLLVNDERIQQAMREQAAKQAEHDEKMLKSIEIKVYAGKANDIIARKLPESPKWKDMEPADATNDSVMDAVKYHAYADAERIEKQYVQGAVEVGRNSMRNVELAKHYGMGPKKLSALIARQAVRAFPDAQNMFTGEPEGDYAKCEYECARILNMLGAADVCVTVDKKDGRVMFYHRIYTGITYTLNYAPTVSYNSVESAVSTVRKGALAQERQTNGFAVRLTGDWDKGNVG